MGRKYTPTSNNIVVRHVAKATVAAAGIIVDPRDFGPYESEVLAVGPAIGRGDLGTLTEISALSPGARVVYRNFVTLERQPGSETVETRLVEYKDILAIVKETPDE
jgi:co-chaperonin GroES (HSP10)